MSKKESAATAATTVKVESVYLENFRLEFTEIPGVSDLSGINSCVIRAHLPGGVRGKSNMMVPSEFVVGLVETVDLHYIKFITWLQTKSGDVGSAQMFVQNKKGEDILRADLEGLEISQVLGVSFGSALIGATDKMTYEVLFRVGRVKYTAL